jgi:hypothetical protein
MAKSESTDDRLERLERLQKLDRVRAKHDINRELSRFQDKVDSAQKPSFNHLEHTDKSRRHIAFVFVYSYVSLVLLILVGVTLYNWLIVHDPKALEMDRLLAQVGSLIGAPLGFVVGYYFKEDAKDRN